jgi:predicted nuclease of predicted toxin-antitoxin system
MTIRFKVDEDLPGEIASMLRAGGHDTVTVLDEGLGGAPDSRVWDAVQQEQRCLLTADKGFADARRFPPGMHGGIVLFRLPSESRSGYVRLIERLLSEFGVETVHGAIVSVSPEAIRVHGKAK